MMSACHTVFGSLTIEPWKIDARHATIAVSKPYPHEIQLKILQLEDQDNEGFADAIAALLDHEGEVTATFFVDEQEQLLTDTKRIAPMPANPPAPAPVPWEPVARNGLLANCPEGQWIITPNDKGEDAIVQFTPEGGRASGRVATAPNVIEAQMFVDLVRSDEHLLPWEEELTANGFRPVLNGQYWVRAANSGQITAQVVNADGISHFQAVWRTRSEAWFSIINSSNGFICQDGHIIHHTSPVQADRLLRVAAHHLTQIASARFFRGGRFNIPLASQ